MKQHSPEWGVLFLFWFVTKYNDSDNLKGYMRNFLASGLCLAAFALVGCGESRKEVEVTGEITINGNPLPEGSITFVASSGDAQTGGGIVKDGKYLAFVSPGPKVVLVVGHEIAGEEPLYQGVPDSPTRQILKTLTPIVYNAAKTSPLKAEISGKTEGLNFELTGEPPKLPTTPP